MSAGAEGAGTAELVVGELVGSGAPYCAAARAGSRRMAKAVVNMVLSRWMARRVENREEVHRVAKNMRGNKRIYVAAENGRWTPVSVGDKPKKG